MDQQQNHIISLIAVFLALGIGILIGASMGENALVLHQIAFIEELKNEILLYRKEIDTQFLSASQLREELLLWESLEEEYLNPLLLENKLKNVEIKVIAQDDLTNGLEEFLNTSGCSYLAFVFAGTSTWRDSFLLEQLSGQMIRPVGKGLELSWQDMLEHILLEGETDQINEITRYMEENKLLRIVKGRTFSFPPEKGSTLYGEEIFIIAGSLDPFFYDIMESLKRQGKDIVQVIDQGHIMEITGTAASFPVINNVHKFYNRIKLLELLQEFAQEGIG
ncbi:MAG: hypothetical protein C4554_10225 [Dethiobacter sp.]|jgi:hypothetical protein|nr:MAG: hypothetical protein C4554_10225 [Dethiobacter sp.]